MRQIPQILKSCTRILLCLALSLTAAEGEPERAPEEVSQELRMAPNSFLLPMELERDFGADNGDAWIYRLMPVYNFPINADWRLTNLDLVTLGSAPGGVPGGVGNPNATPGERAFGLSDWVHLTMVTPEQSSPIWGAGVAVGVPTATDDVLGSGKWTAGPALRLAYRIRAWDFSVVAAQRWSFAGSSSRGDVNQLMMRGAFRGQLPDNWYFVSAPIVTVNWRAPSGQRWLVPVGGGLGRTFTLNRRNWAWSVQAYYNVIRPDAAPDWAARVGLVVALPER